DDLHASRQLPFDEPRVAASDVERVVVEERLERRDRLAEPAIPFPLARLLERLEPELVLVGLVPPRRVMAELQVGHETALEEEGAPEGRPERDHELDAVALHDAEALHVRVVAAAYGLAESFREHAVQVVSDPTGPEVPGLSGDAPPDDAGKTHGDA